LNKEKVKSNVCLIKDCGRPTHKNSEYCIFHAIAEEKTEKKFKIALKKYTKEIKEDKNYDFRGFIFIGNIDFKKDLNIAIFFKNADFIDATFEASANFMGATFKGNTDFSNTNFEGKANFLGATFEKDNKFEDTIFVRKANFKGATFRGDSEFCSTIFKEFTSFEGAIFKGFTKFMKTIFKRNVNFLGTIFGGDNNEFWDDIFEEKANFGDNIFDGNFCFFAKTIKGNLNFSNAILPHGKTFELDINNKILISLKKSYFENVYLKLVLGEKTLIDFSDALFRNTKFTKGQIENHILQEERKDFFQAEEIYLLLKNNFRNIGRYEDESWAFKKEKDMERKGNCHFNTLHKWLWSCFLNGIFGYGEQPGKVIISAISIILIFTFLFMSSGISGTGIEGSISKNFLDCVYFSVITFTTLGYGDFRPLEGWGRIFAGTEAFIGALMMALFVYTFARRTGGR